MKPNTLMLMRCVLVFQLEAVRRSRTWDPIQQNLSKIYIERKIHKPKTRAEKRDNDLLILIRCFII